MNRRLIVVIFCTLIAIISVAGLSHYMNLIDEKAKKDKTKLNEIILEVIKEHKKELSQFNDHNGEKMDYLTPFIIEYYSEFNHPKKSTLRTLLKSALEKEADKIDPTDADKLKEIAIKVINEHVDELPALGDHTGDKVDYLTPFIHKYYEDGNYPEREFLRSIVKGLLESGEYLNE